MRSANVDGSSNSAKSLRRGARTGADLNPLKRRGGLLRSNLLHRMYVFWA